MAYYDALSAKWATLTGTTEQKLSEINAATVSGANIDVPVGQVAGYLALSGLLPGIQSFAGNPPVGANAGAIVAAKGIVTLLATPQVTVFETSKAETHAAIQTMLGALVAMSLISSTDAATLLGMAATTLPWWQFIGLTSPINLADLEAAGGLS